VYERGRERGESVDNGVRKILRGGWLDDEG